MIIYLDESGDLGLDVSKAGTTRHFVITLLVCDSRQASDGFRFAVRRTMKNKLRSKKGAVGEIKGSETLLSVKRYFFRHVPQNGWRLYTVIIDKVRLLEKLSAPIDPHRIYNFMARLILSRISFADADGAVTLVVDRSKGREGIRAFNDYIANHLAGFLPLKVPLNIYHEPSHVNSGIQAVDLFSWGILRKYEFSEEVWYDDFKRMIEVETTYPE